MEDPKCFSNAQADVELCRGRRGKGSGTSSSNQTAVIVPQTSISQCYDYTKKLTVLLNSPQKQVDYVY